MTKEFLIPEAALLQNMIALGKPGSGKSSKLRIIVEHLLKQKRPVTVLDPKGDWWGLKISADGKGLGFSVVIFGGDHADIPITEHSGVLVAQIVAAGNHSCIIDLGGWMPGPRSRFFVDFASTLFKLPHPAMHLVMDECHNFAPQGKVLDPMAGKSLHWANRLASEGRSKGVTVFAASQRPQKVHKDFVTTCETLIACRVIHSLDRGAIKDWIDGCADPVLGKQIMNEVAMMPRREAWVWSPECNFGPERMDFPFFTTFDSFSPQANLVPHTLPPAMGLEEIRLKMATVIEEAQKNDPAVLHKRIAELQQQLAKKSQLIYTQQDMNRALEQAHTECRAAQPAATSDEAKGLMQSMQKILAIAAKHAPAPAARAPEIKVYPEKRSDHTITIEKVSASTVSPTVRKILDVIHRSNPVALSFEAAATRAGVSRRSSAYRTYRKDVEQSGEVKRREDGRWVSVDGFTAPAGAGVNALEEFANKLPPSYARMLRELATAGHACTKGEVAQLADVSPTSSGLNAGLKELMALELIEEFNGLYSLNPNLR